MHKGHSMYFDILHILCWVPPFSYCLIWIQRAKSPHILAWAPSASSSLPSLHFPCICPSSTYGRCWTAQLTQQRCRHRSVFVWVCRLFIKSTMAQREAGVHNVRTDSIINLHWRKRGITRVERLLWGSWSRPSMPNIRKKSADIKDIS